MTGLSQATRALLLAAKKDGPGAAARSKIWSGVAWTAGVGAVGTAAGTSSIAAGAGVTTSAGKLLAMGALLGSVVTVGVTLAVLRIGVLGPPRPAPGSVAAAPEEERPVELAESPFAPAAPIAFGVSNARLPERVPPRPIALAAPDSAPHEDPLMREAALVAEARGSLVRGDAARALATVRAAGSARLHALEPEELSLESRALRMLGRDAEAAEVDVRLKVRYPDHALSR